MNTDPFDKLYLVPVVNVSAETVPAYGLMRHTGTRDSLGRAKIAKPNADSDRDVLVNGPSEIPAGGAGFGFIEIGDCPAKFNVTDGAPVANSQWGSKNGSWLLAKDKVGFRIRGAADGAYVVVSRNYTDVPPAYPYGSYPDDNPGTSVKHSAILNLGCVGDNITADEVEYTTSLIRGRLTISMRVVRSQFIAVPTVCTEVVDHVAATLSSVGVTCVDGVIIVTQPTLTLTNIFKNVKTIACGACP